MTIERQVLTQSEWTQLASDPLPPLLALWADTREVHALLRHDNQPPLLVSTLVEAGLYPALSPQRPPATWFERMVHDLWGYVAVGSAELRPWLDHGTWPQSAPMALRPGPPGKPPEPEPLAEGDTWDQLLLGPVHGLIEPAAHLRLIGHGESIARVEARLGYTHKGTLTLMRGKSPRAAARFAARLCGEATVAHSIAFAHATEAALACEVPPRALAWRAIMAEIERIANHLDVLAAVAEAVEFELLATRCARHSEAMRHAGEVAFGHRLLMDCVIPGGIAADVAAGGIEAIRRALSALATDLAGIERLVPFGGQLSGIGVVTDATFASGVAARAAGRAGDLRVSPGYPPYPALSPAPSGLAVGDAAARMQVRLTEIGESIRLANELLASLPEGAVSVALPPASGEGLGFAEGPNGDVWHWLRLDHGQIASVFMCDPAWVHWRLLEAMMAGGLADGLKLTMASLGLSSSGVDL
jgi:Ni,Fe-hydrogenase III large subunit